MMKRILSVALALIMIFALTATVAAKESPSAKDYYLITVSTEPADGSLGTADTNKDKVLKTATGEDGQVTLTADQTKGFFTLWIIDGDYDIVSGNESSPVLTIVPKSDIHAIANFRINEEYLTITVSVIGDGTASADPTQVELGSNDLVTLTAVDGADTFVDWTLECKYDIVEGNLKSRKLVIRPYTDIHAIATFTSSEKPTTPSSSKPASSGSNSSSTSPKTGDPLFIILGLAVLALGAGALAVKKIKG